LPPAESIDPKGNWILCHAVCRWCGRPSWDHFPEGVVAGRYRCAYCGRTQAEPDDERRCVACGKPGSALQRVFPTDSASHGRKDGFPGWLCAEHQLLGDEVLYRHIEEDARVVLA
jgi:ribosomal protein L37E